METSSLAVAEGCGSLLAPSDEILAEFQDWRGKKSIKDTTVATIFQSAGLQRCGSDWYAMNYGNVNILCLRCAKRLGWRW